MTILEHYKNEQEKNIDHDFTYYIGLKVKYVIGYKDDIELWSEDVKIIDDYIEDSCGEGCCDGFTLKGNSNLIYNANQLKIID